MSLIDLISASAPVNIPPEEIHNKTEFTRSNEGTILCIVWTVSQILLKQKLLPKVVGRFPVSIILAHKKTEFVLAHKWTLLYIYYKALQRIYSNLV